MAVRSESSGWDAAIAAAWAALAFVVASEAAAAIAAAWAAAADPDASAPTSEAVTVTSAVRACPLTVRLVGTAPSVVAVTAAAAPMASYRASPRALFRYCV